MERAMKSQQAEHTRGGPFKELMMMIVVIGFIVSALAGLGALYWLESAPEAASAGTPAAATLVESARPKVMVAGANLPVLHTDVYFDFKSARLRADAARMLQDNAEAMTRTESWAVLVTGYADRQGPPTYNRTLAQRRGETVKQFLVELGVPETAIKVVTLGQEATLCDDPGQECQQLNRRVHLEIRNLGPMALAPRGPRSDDVAKP
jgi:outer membrane protein OmpA-like peptidoglycan-associated protein